MVVLTESGLNKRHREFNQKVIEAAEKNLKFDEVKAEGVESDIDILFKIDLCSKYKDIKYILEVLKSSDSIFISRALKCTWMFDLEFSNFINPQYINDEIFPHISLKLKRKVLNTISIHIKDEKRALEFYEYCKSLNFFNIAAKYLLYTSEETKLKELRENTSLFRDKDLSFLKNFVKHSYALAETILEVMPERNLLLEFNYLYFVEGVGEKYLDLLENYDNLEKNYYRFPKFGLRMSKNIILKHKNRIYKKPELYTSLINSSMFRKYSTVEDAKYYTTVLLPEDSNAFWNENYYESKKHFFDIIPKEQKYHFIKKLFDVKYPGKPFEMSIEFYNLSYYDLIIDPQLKEDWALRQVKSEKEILGSGKDFLWYRFVNFEKAFDAVKKYIRITIDRDVRAQITNVLIESAKTCRELETLFKYYYERHINEERFRKERFVEAVDKLHNIFDFDADCFNAFDKIYYSLEVYNTLSTYYCNPNYLTIGLIYRIINEMEMVEALIKYMDNSIAFYKLKTYTDKLSAENSILVYNYLMEFYLNKIKSFDTQPFNETVKLGVRKYIRFALDLMIQYNKSKDEIPEIVLKYVHLDWEEFKYHFYFREPVVKMLSPNDLLRCLKRDTSEFVTKFSIVKELIKDDDRLRFNHILRKLKVYFTNDVAKEYFQLYEIILAERDLNKYSINILVFGIIQLADKEKLETFMAMYMPAEPKIDHVNIDRKLLSIQSAICSFAGYARPPVPLALMLKFIKGDYTKYCLPLFNMYLANLPPALCIEFVNSIIDAPLSLQKHGLRLAFNCLACNVIKSLVTDVWKRTKNISLRLIIYKSLLEKIYQVDSGNKLSLFETLNNFTTTIYEEDEDELFRLLTSNNLPKNLLNEHFKTVYVTFEKLPFKTRYIGYRQIVVSCLENNLKLIEPNTFIEQIINEHVQYVFDGSHDERYHMLRDCGVIKHKWHLAVAYISLLESTQNMDYKLNLVKQIISKCIQKWEVIHENKAIYRNFLAIFLDLLKTKAYSQDVTTYRQGNIIFEYILNELVNSLPTKEIYTTVWDLKLYILMRNSIIDGSENRKSLNAAKILKETGTKFGKECVALTLDYIQKDMFWIMFEEDIRNLIHNQVQNIDSYLTNHFGELHGESALVYVADQLTDVKRFETFFLAAKLLQNRTIPIELLNKLNNFEDKQIQCFVYEKLMKNNSQGTSFI